MSGHTRTSGAVKVNPSKKTPKVGIIYPGSYAEGMSNLAFQELFSLCALNKSVSPVRFFSHESNEYNENSENNYSDNSRPEKNHLHDSRGRRNGCISAPFLFSPEGADVSSICGAVITSSFETDILNLLKIALCLKKYNIPSLLGGLTAVQHADTLRSFFTRIYTGVINNEISAFFNHLPDIPFSDACSSLSSSEFVTPPSADKNKPLICHTALLSDSTVFKNTFLIETSRGCRRRCNFCILSKKSGGYYEHPSSEILSIISKLPSEVKKIGLVSAAFTDRSDCIALIESINAIGKEVTVASLRMEQLTERLISLLKANNQRTLTLAPETADLKIRTNIGKAYSPEHLLRCAYLAGSAGFHRLKLYYMLGLPEEDDKTAEEITVQIRQCRDALNRGAQRSGIMPKLQISISPFVPKKGTVLEHAVFAEEHDIKRRVKIIKSRASSLGGVSVDTESYRFARLQYVVSHKIEELLPLALRIVEENGSIRELEKISRKI